MWRDPPTSELQSENTQLLIRESNPRAPFFSSIWRSFTAQPPAKRSEQELQKRKDDKTITITNTDTITEQLTIYHNQTVYTTLTTEVFFTRNITSFVPTTITQNMTLTSSLTVSVPVTTTLSMTVPSTTTSHETPTSSHNAPNAAANSQSPVVASEQHHNLSTRWILAIVFGILGFLVLLFAVLWGIRWFLQKYRHERVERKRLQTEANELPVMKMVDGGGGKESGGNGGGFAVE